MKTFLVKVYDRTVKTFEKEFVAETAEAARAQAEEEELSSENGWAERYEELFSEQYIESVEEVEDAERDGDENGLPSLPAE